MELKNNNGVAQADSVFAFGSLQVLADSFILAFLLDGILPKKLIAFGAY